MHGVEESGHDKLWEWFGLSHASWLTLPRVLMHAMSDEWQGKMAELLREYGEEFGGAEPDLEVYVSVKRDRSFCRIPEWLVGYRHPDGAAIEAARSPRDKPRIDPDRPPVAS
jgi:hypothetical protein